MNQALTAELLRTLLNYDPLTGVFTNKVARSAGSKVGDVAGWTDANEYRSIKVDRQAYLAHRLAWLHFHGHWPSMQIDHINGRRDDNRIANLRDVSAAVNQQNVHTVPRNNRLGVLGVSRNGKRGFQASIEAQGKRHYLGTFGSTGEASAAYQAAKARLHPLAASAAA